MNNRYSAFLLHITISALVLLTVYFLTREIWYPSYFYDLDGGFEATKVVFAVDLVLGPLMTFFIYKPKKKGLIFDLCCIGLIQVLALLYGLSLLYNYRPVALVLQNNTFFSVTDDVFKNYSSNYSAGSSNDSIQRCGIACYILDNTKESRMSIISTGIPARVRQEFYIDYADGWQSYSAGSASFFDVTKLKEDDKIELLDARAKLATEDESLAEADMGFIPVFGRYITGYFIVHKKSGQILFLVEQKPPISLDA